MCVLHVLPLPSFLSLFGLVRSVRPPLSAEQPNTHIYQNTGQQQTGRSWRKTGNRNKSKGDETPSKTEREWGGTRKVKADRQANGVTPMTQGEEKEDAWGTYLNFTLS